VVEEAIQIVDKGNYYLILSGASSDEGAGQISGMVSVILDRTCFYIRFMLTNFLKRG